MAEMASGEQGLLQECMLYNRSWGACRLAGVRARTACTRPLSAR